MNTTAAAAEKYAGISISIKSVSALRVSYAPFDHFYSQLLAHYWLNATRRLHERSVKQIKQNNELNLSCWQSVNEGAYFSGIFKFFGEK